MSKTTLEQDFQYEIDAQNTLKNFAKQAIAIFLPKLAEFVGKKIFTASGEKTKAFVMDYEIIRSLVPQPQQLGDLKPQIQNCYLDTKYGCLNLEISLCLYGNGGSKYTKRTVELGKSKDGQIIDSLNTYEDIVKMYGFDDLINAEEELQKIRKFKELEKQAQEAQSRIKVDVAFYKYL
jgi:hypothetical protein